MKRMAVMLSLLLATLSAIPGHAFAAEGVAVVDPGRLSEFWIAKGMAANDGSYLTFGQSRDDSYGCVAQGFVIDREGRIVPGRVLRWALSSGVPKWRRRELLILFHNSTGLLGTYVPAAANASRREVFTVASLPYFGQKLASQLSDAQKTEFSDRLRESCRIDDLPGWMAAHGADAGKVPEPELAPVLVPDTRP